MNNCEENKLGNVLVIAVFALSFVIFRIYSNYTSKLSEEDKIYKFESSKKYFDKYREENEEYFSLN